MMFQQAFRALGSHNYRLWVPSAFVSNIGTSVQRTAQDWLVLTQLTHRSASALGIVMALQFGPQLLLTPWTGLVADRCNRRRILMFTQAAMGFLALVLGLLTMAGMIRLPIVYVFALLFGTVFAFDAPVRQTFVAELVGDDGLPGAIALNATSFNGARMIGPAVAGVVIGSAGTGWAFLINGASFLAVLASLASLRPAELNVSARAARGAIGFADGFRYAWRRYDLRMLLIILFVIGAFGMNFQIFISTMATRVFNTDAAGYGVLASTMAAGTVAGSLVIGHASGLRALVGANILFGAGCLMAAVAPAYWVFAAALALIGAAVLGFTNITNSLMQLSTIPDMRGRVMALRLGVMLGGTLIGAPIVGAIADHAGPRLALGVGAASGFVAAWIAATMLRRSNSVPAAQK